MVKNNGRFIFMNKTASLKNSSERGLLLCALRGLLSAVLVSLALAALTATLGLAMKTPTEYTKIFACISLFGAAFAGGFSAAKAKGSGTLICGALTALFIIALTALLSLALSLKINYSLFAFCAPCVLICSVLGANIGVGFSAIGAKKKKKIIKNRT
jgi:putative membrane protein (TIGR04086 family)